MIARYLFLAAATSLLAFPVSGADSAERTAKLVSVLQSPDASTFDKARACQQLGEIGNRDAVAALAALLPDPHLGAYARSGLEGILDPSATAALREAAMKLVGPARAGVVNSLGAIRDAAAVELLGKLAADPASGVANEALLALGNVSSAESIQILRQSLANGPETARAEAAAGCLLAADHQRSAGNRDQATALYDAVRLAKVSTACRAGATRGAILARTTDRVPFLVEQLKSSELPIRNAALLAIREVPDPKMAEALNKELVRVTPELQVLLLLALADCHNTQSVAAVDALAKSSNPEVRKTALRVLGQLGPAAEPALLKALEQDQGPEYKAVTLDALRRMPGSAVDDLLVQSLASAKPGLRIELIRLLNNRAVTKASGEILKQATGPDRAVSLAALSALQSLAGDSEVPGLMALIKICSDQEARSTAETALAGACTRSSAQPPAAETVLGELQQASKPADKNSWVRVLTIVGYAKALPAIEAAASDPDEAVAGHALEQLGRWPDAAPMGTLLKAMEDGASPALRNRALRAVLDLSATAIDDAQVPQPTVAQWLQRAHSVAPSIAEKRRILGLLGRLKTMESFAILQSYLETTELRTEAAAGILQIGPALAKQGDTGALRAALEKIAASVTNTDLRNRAQQVLKTIPAQRRPVPEHTSEPTGQ